MKRSAEFLLLRYAGPGTTLVPIAVLLLDVQRDRVHLRIRSDLASVCDSADAEIIGLTLSELASEASSGSGSAIVSHLEDTLSNTIRITNRIRIEIDGVGKTLDSLVKQYLPKDNESTRTPGYF